MQKTHESENLLSLFRTCSHLIGRGHHHRKGGGHGQGRVLSILSKNDTMSQKDLTELIQVRSSSLSELLSKLEKNGYITSEKDEEDKRSANITITEAGKIVASEHMEKRKAMAIELFKSLTEEEQTELSKLLSKLSTAWLEEHNPEDLEHGCKKHGHHHGGHHHRHHYDKEHKKCRHHHDDEQNDSHVDTSNNEN